MPTASTNQPSWLLEQSEYGDLFNQEFDFIRGGSLSVQNNSDSASLDYIWVRRRSRANYDLPGVDDPPELNYYENIFTQEPTALSWWEVNSQSSGNSGGSILVPADGNPLAEEELYYLGIDGTAAANPFIGASSIRFQSSDPSLDNRVFDILIADTYEVTEVIVEYPETANNSTVTSVPESSSALGILLFGTMGVGFLLKRRLSRAS